MHEQKNPNLSPVVALVAVALLVALALGLGAVSLTKGSARAEAAATPTPIAAVPPAQIHRIDFIGTKLVMAAGANGLLVDLAVQARMDGGRQVYISSFLEPGVDDVLQNDSALRRARVVKHALEANGVDPSSLVLHKPLLSAGDLQQARRVEIVLR